MRAILLAVRALLAVALSIGLIVGCSGGGGGDGDDDDLLDDDEADDDGYDDDYDDDDDDDYDDDDDDDDDDIEPPEPEEESDPGKKPVFCDDGLFVLNSADDFLSRIDSQSLRVTTVDVGLTPSVLRALDDCSVLITLNVGDDTVSVIDPDDNHVDELEVRPGLNRLEAAPGGRYALAYHRFESGSAGFTEISIVDTQALSVRSLAVGFSPDDVQFFAGDRVLLSSSLQLALVSLSDAALTVLPAGIDPDQGERISKVAVTADGGYALIMVTASTKLRALKLSDRTVSEVEVGCYPTDLEAAEDGDKSLVVCREEKSINVLNNLTLELTHFSTTQVIGSGELTADGGRALLFTNAEPVEKVHLLDTASGEIETHMTYKPLFAAAIAPHDVGAVLFHWGGDGEPTDPLDEYFDSVEALSVMSLSDSRINTIEVPETPLEVAFDDQGLHAIVPMPAHKQVVMLDMLGGLADLLSVPSTPLEVGMVSDAGMAYVLQDHPLGRISFIDADTLRIRTITGFLLNGRIEP